MWYTTDVDNSQRYVYRVLRIIRGTTVDGPGFRTAIYIAGCRHQCPGCHNPVSHDFDAGDAMTLDEIMEIVEEEDFDVTLSGGDPLYSPQATAQLVERLKQNGRNVWIYTGFTWEQILADDSLKKAVEKADVVVDGPFVMELRDESLPFRGSSNQRIIRVQEALGNKS